jgi:hypothetical protein
MTLTTREFFKESCHKCTNAACDMHGRTFLSNR